MAEQVMSKAEFIAEVQAITGSSKKEATAGVNAALRIIEDQLVQGNNIQFTGFGTFEVKQRAARTGHNPQTGEKILIQAKKVPAFAPGKTLRDVVRDSYMLQNA